MRAALVQSAVTRRHAPNTALRCDASRLVHVHLQKRRVRILRGLSAGWKVPARLACIRGPHASHAVFPLCHTFSDSEANTGPIRLHGGHQVALKSTTSWRSRGRRVSAHKSTVDRKRVSSTHQRARVFGVAVRCGPVRVVVHRDDSPARRARRLNLPRQEAQELHKHVQGEQDGPRRQVHDCCTR